jgi:hypothetical protein
LWGRKVWGPNSRRTNFNGKLFFTTNKQSTRFGNQKLFNPCDLLGLVMKANGLRGQGERVSQMLASRIPLAAERKPSKSSVIRGQKKRR